MGASSVSSVQGEPVIGSSTRGPLYEAPSKAVLYVIIDIFIRLHARGPVQSHIAAPAAGPFCSASAWGLLQSVRGKILRGDAPFSFVRL